jgi:2-oxoglutarate ferredoxin oxidoreductase subunit delta
MEKEEIKIQISEDYCKGCQFCIVSCPKKVLSRSEKISKRGFHFPVVKAIARCTGCRICQNICPDFAIYVED